MSLMFFLAENFNQPLNNWDISNDTNMNQMFLQNHPLFLSLRTKEQKAAHAIQKSAKRWLRTKRLEPEKDATGIQQTSVRKNKRGKKGLLVGTTSAKTAVGNVDDTKRKRSNSTQLNETLKRGKKSLLLETTSAPTVGNVDDTNRKRSNSTQSSETAKRRKNRS